MVGRRRCAHCRARNLLVVRCVNSRLLQDGSRRGRSVAQLRSHSRDIVRRVASCRSICRALSSSLLRLVVPAVRIVVGTALVVAAAAAAVFAAVVDIVDVVDAVAAVAAVDDAVVDDAVVDVAVSAAAAAVAVAALSE